MPNNIAIVKQLQTELERAHKLSMSDPAIDWKAWSIAKAALLAVAPLLPEENAVQVLRIVGTIDEAYTIEG